MLLASIIILQIFHYPDQVRLNKTFSPFPTCIIGSNTIKSEMGIKSISSDWVYFTKLSSDVCVC